MSECVQLARYISVPIALRYGTLGPITKATLKFHFCYVSDFPCHKFPGNSSLNSFEFIKNNLMKKEKERKSNAHERTFVLLNMQSFSSLKTSLKPLAPTHSIQSKANQPLLQSESMDSSSLLLLLLLGFFCFSEFTSHDQLIPKDEGITTVISLVLSISGENETWVLLLKKFGEKEK
uniref:Uncharacterized protein n=1 Tax=Vitis vinifera TaxID=29760 RepID=F6H1U7_VITVI